MTPINLSKDQREVVDINEGAVLVVAAAGSGKTRVLTERIKRLLVESKSNILTITFTNKAAEELKERLTINESDKRRIFVGTFHNFCQSILELRFKLLGYIAMPHIFEDDSDRIEIIEQAINDIPHLRQKYLGMDGKSRSEYKYSTLSYISEIKRELGILDSDSLDGVEKDRFLLYEAYQDLLLSNNAIDFDDLILLTYQLLSNNDAVASLYRKTYDIVCVDEAQDLNKSQYFLLRALAGNQIKNIMMVGDPNQSIYGFNGSSADYMTKHFVSDFDAKIFHLIENYRCSKNVADAANKLLNLPPSNSDYVINGIFRVRGFENEINEASYVIKTITKLLEIKQHPDIEKEINYNSISILARNRYVFRELDSKLTEAGIPFYYKSGNSGLKFNSKLMQVFDCYFRIKVNPLDKLHIARLQKILEVENIMDSSELKISNLPTAAQVMDLVERINVDNLSTEIRQFRQKLIDNIFAVKDDDERKSIIDDIDELKSHWIAYQTKNPKRTLVGFKNAMALGTTSSQKAETGVILSTVHTMKGQESDIVFIIGMDEGTFPDFRAVSKGGLELQQEQNNAYVAFTRARRFLFVSYPKTRQMPWGDIRTKKPSRFLNNLI